MVQITAACILAPRDRYTFRKRPSLPPLFPPMEFLSSGRERGFVEGKGMEWRRGEERKDESKGGEFNKGSKREKVARNVPATLMRPRFKLVIPRKSH